MKTSVKRQCLRLMLGANRKVTSIRWIGSVTGWVTTSELGHSRSQTYVKANNGVEKSFLPKKRKRGLRRGKRRSRGGKPRSNVRPAAPESKTRVRVERHRERLFTIMRKSQNVLMLRTKQFLARPGIREDLERYNALRQIWRDHSSNYPFKFRRLFFGMNFTEYLATMDPQIAEAPPLPPRRRGPTFTVGAREFEVPSGRTGYFPPWGVSNKVDHGQNQKDGFGPDPCPWCAEEWFADGELGAPHAKCLRIHLCVRNPERALRSERVSRLHRSNAISRRNSRQ